MFNKLFETYEKIIFFDTETTGFDYKGADQIIELAAVCINSDGSVDRMDEFVHLYKMQEVPERITNLTGITDLDIALSGHDIKNVLKEFFALIGNGKCRALLVAHNAQFDISFLNYSTLPFVKSDWVPSFASVDYLDTLTVFKDRTKFNHKLEDAIRHYGLQNIVKNSHRAVDDCMALLEVTKAMEEENNNLDTYVNVFSYVAKYGEPKSKIGKVTYIAS